MFGVIIGCGQAPRLLLDWGELSALLLLDSHLVDIIFLI